MFHAGAERCVPEDRVGARKPSLHQRPAGAFGRRLLCSLSRSGRCRSMALAPGSFRSPAVAPKPPRARVHLGGWRLVASAGDDLYGGISVAGCPRLHVPNENGAIVTLANAVSIGAPRSRSRPASRQGTTRP